MGGNKKALLEIHADDFSRHPILTCAHRLSEGADNADDIVEDAWETNKHVPDILSGKYDVCRWEITC